MHLSKLTKMQEEDIKKREFSMKTFLSMQLEMKNVNYAN